MQHEGAREIEVQALAGEFYTTVLSRLHRVLNPQSYFEIGTATGESLALAQCASIAVDPVFGLGVDVVGRKPLCALFQLPSDRFFEAHSPTDILGRAIDMAFLDGMHLAEFLLRDFINTERHCRPNSVVMLHDCIPVNPYIADRMQSSTRRKHMGSHPHAWTGDVWKVALALKQYRPDLSILSLDAQPTGLIVITNLDPASSTLSDNYEKICAWFRKTDLDQYGLERYLAELSIVSTSVLSSAEDIASYYWL